MGSVKTYVPLLVLAIACSAQSVSPSFDEEYNRAIEQNPPGVTFTISIPANSTYHLSDIIRFQVMFTSTNARLYTAELSGAGSAAGASFDFVIQGPGVAAPIHSQASHPLAYVVRRMDLKPGDYAIFAQTRSVMRGWPKSQHDAFHAVSDLLVTSSNILHITILPDVADSTSGRP